MRKWCQACSDWVEKEDLSIGEGYYEFVTVCAVCFSSVADEPPDDEPNDSLPDWAEWYSNVSDSVASEYPEILNPEIDDF